jgi:hypothetical protein
VLLQAAGSEPSGPRWRLATALNAVKRASR